MKKDKMARKFEMNTSKTLEELKEKTVKVNKYLAFTVIEVVIILIYSILAFSMPTVNREYSTGMLNQNVDEKRFETPFEGLPKGIYQVSISYEAEGEGCLAEVAAESDVARNLFADQVALTQTKKEISFKFWANYELKSFRINLRQGDATSLTIHKVNILTSPETAVYQIFKALCFLILLNVLALLIHKKDRIRNCSNTPIAIGLFVTICVVCYPLFTEFLLYGHDISFHLMRIEGLKEGLLGGQFPVRVQPNWIWGYGYPVSVFYGDTLLYIPAVLRLFGMPLQSAYKCYMALINIGTVLISYYCFLKIGKDKVVAMVTSMIYSMAVYRLVCMYVRASIGEYTAFMFFPLIMCGFYLTFCESVDSKNYKRIWIYYVLGFSGLIQSHELSCEMIIPFCVMICIICWKKLIRKQTWILLVKSAVMTILANLWFLIPFLTYMTGNFCVKTAMAEGNIQSLGSSLAELFAFSTVSNGWMGRPSTPIGSKIPTAIGCAMTILLIITLLVILNRKYIKCERTLRKTIEISGMISILCIYLSTYYFPYDVIWKKAKWIGKLCSSIQFPWRFLSFAIPFLCLMGCIVLILCKKIYSRKKARLIMIFICLIAFIQSYTFLNNAVRDNSIFFQYDSATLKTNEIFQGYFLIEGSNAGRAETEQSILLNNVSCEKYTREHGQIEAMCSALGTDAYVDFPMFNYSGYVAYDINTNERLNTVLGDNNRIRVLFPENYSGTIRISYQESVIWVVANWISAISMIVMILAGTGIMQMIVAQLKKRIYNRNVERKEISNDIS